MFGLEQKIAIFLNDGDKEPVIQSKVRSIFIDEFEEECLASRSLLKALKNIKSLTEEDRELSDKCSTGDNQESADKEAIREIVNDNNREDVVSTFRAKAERVLIDKGVSETDRKKALEKLNEQLEIHFDTMQTIQAWIDKIYETEESLRGQGVTEEKIIKELEDLCNRLQLFIYISINHPNIFTSNNKAQALSLNS